MDVSALLYGFRNACPSDAPEKALALASARAIMAQRIPDYDFDDHVRHLCRDIVGQRFGGDATDAYFTLVMILLRQDMPHIDPFLGAVLNSVVLQLSFQTRLALDGVMGRPEAVVYEGASEYFQISMIHGNEIFGLHVTDLADRRLLPGWNDRYPELALHEPNLRRALPPEVGELLASAGRDRIGALMIIDPVAELGDFVIADRYDYLLEKVSRHTAYCFSGTPQQVLRVGREFADRYPDCILRTRAYTRHYGREQVIRAILVCENIPELPRIRVALGNWQRLTFAEATPKKGSVLPGIAVINYFKGETNRIEWLDGQEIGRWEPCRIKRPVILSSSAPLPGEIRSRVSDDTEVYHTVVALDHGMMIPSIAPGHATYIHSTGGGEILLDFGDERRNIEGSPIFRDAERDRVGNLVGQIKVDDIMRVEGPALPLAFTPILHKWHSHFLIQCLPRVKIIRDLVDDVALLVPNDLRPKQREMIELLGIRPERIISVPADTIIQADRLLVPRAWRLAFSAYTAAIYQDLVDRFGASSAEPRRRVLISRESRKTWRNLLNYDTIRSLLVERYGFEEIAPERLTLEEEINLYSSAEIIAGAEGAGLYGSVFASAGTTVLSISDEDYAMPILGTLAYQRGFDVGYIFGESMRADTDLARRLPFGHSDFVVDPRRVGDAVEQAIELSGTRC